MQIGAPIPWWGVAAAVLVAATIAWWAYAGPPVDLTRRQRTILTALRLCALLVVLFVLLRPLRTEPAPAAGGVVAVLVDHSRSMAVRDAGGMPRMEFARELVRDRLLPALEEVIDVEVLAFGETLAAADVDELAAEASRSDITGALDGVPARFAGRALVGIVIVSDGVATGGRDAAEAAARSSAPIYTLGVGSTRPGPDREISALEAGQPVGAGSVVDVSATIVSHGLGDAPFDVRLSVGGRLVGVRRVRAGPRRRTDHRGVSGRARSGAALGVHRRTTGRRGRTGAREQPPAGSGAPAGKGRAASCSSKGRRATSTASSSAPWLADPGIAFDAVVRKGQNAQGEQTFYVQGDPERTGTLAAGYPRTRAALFQYDAVVLANIEAEFFRPDQLDMTAAFVSERGGGLLLFGPASLRRQGYLGSSLEPVVPAQLADRLGLTDAGRDGDTADRFAPTPAGFAHPMLRLGSTVEETRSRWEAVPALAGSVRIGPVRPGAAVLAVTTSGSGPERPLVVVQRYGAGRSMILAGRATWRWRMLLPADDRTYERYWGQVARWAGGGRR